MKKCILMLFLIFTSSAFAETNKNMISQCSVVATMLSAISLRDNWSQQAKNNIEGLLDKYKTLGIREHGSMAKFAEYNGSYGMSFYNYLKAQPESALAPYIKKCGDWQPQ